MVRALFGLAVLCLGCTAEVVEEPPDAPEFATRAPWSFVFDATLRAAPRELDENPFQPKRPACWPDASEVSRWTEERASREPEPEPRLGGIYRTAGFMQHLEIHEDGRYEWWSSGCTGNRLELGFVDVFEDWVVLHTSECDFGFAPRSRRAYLLREVEDGWTVLIDPESEREFAKHPRTRDDDDSGDDWFWEYPEK